MGYESPIEDAYERLRESGVPEGEIDVRKALEERLIDACAIVQETCEQNVAKMAILLAGGTMEEAMEDTKPLGNFAEHFENYRRALGDAARFMAQDGPAARAGITAEAA